MKAELVPENGDPPIVIEKDLTVVGRREYCDVIVDDSSISKRHCVLVKTDGLLVIRDLGSTNGTKVKGQRVKWAALLPDDRISLGSYKFRVYLGPDDTPGPAELFRMRRAREKESGLETPDIPTWTATDKYSTGTTSGRPGVEQPALSIEETPIGPDGRIPNVPVGQGFDPLISNATTPIDGQEPLLEID